MSISGCWALPDLGLKRPLNVFFLLFKAFGFEVVEGVLELVLVHLFAAGFACDCVEELTVGVVVEGELAFGDVDEFDELVSTVHWVTSTGLAVEGRWCNAKSANDIPVALTHHPWQVGFSEPVLASPPAPSLRFKLSMFWLNIDNVVPFFGCYSLLISRGSCLY